jgi:hypothetical protein
VGFVKPDGRDGEAGAGGKVTDGQGGVVQFPLDLKLT